jgi:hypothetical protein
MKKVIALLAVCGFALAFVACGKKAEEASTGDTTQVVETAPAAPAIDSAATAQDTTDSAAH